MHIQPYTLDQRAGWRIANNRIALVFLAGGGHLASITRMDTPFPTSLRDAVARGSLFGQPAFAWLGARETRDFSYRIRFAPSPGS